MLNAAPVAGDDPWYSTAEDTDLTVSSSDTTLPDDDWDPEGNSLSAAIDSLTKVTEKDGTTATTNVVEYTYDVFNRRIGKEVDTASPVDMADAAIERYIYDDLNGITSVDGGNVVLDFADPDGSGSQPSALSSRQLFGNAVDRILAQEDVTESLTSPARVLWHLTDHLQTVRDLAKNNGSLGEHYKYDSYGQIISGDTSVTRYLYTSREYDADIGLQHSRAHWYDAETGRWISNDPIAFEAGDANPYRYVGNGPTNYTDPSGLRMETGTAQQIEQQIEQLIEQLNEEQSQFSTCEDRMDQIALELGDILQQALNEHLNQLYLAQLLDGLGELLGLELDEREYYEIIDEQLQEQREQQYEDSLERWDDEIRDEFLEDIEVIPLPEIRDMPIPEMPPVRD